MPAAKLLSAATVSDRPEHDPREGRLPPSSRRGRVTSYAIPGSNVTVERDLPLEMADGVILFADVYRPPGEGPHPVVLISHPYDKTAAESNFGYNHPSYYAGQGYIAVSQDCRGRGRSEGTFYPFRHEADDLCRTIEWCARLPGSDGQVATYGFSYPGLNQLLAAQSQPVGLKAIAPAFTAGSPYAEWIYRQGAFSLAFAASWANYLALDMAVRRRDDAAFGAYAGALGAAAGLFWVLPLAAHPALTAGDTPFYLDWLAHSSLDDYWRPFEVDHAAVDVPALVVGGWYDVFVRGTVRSFRELAARGGAPQKLVVGPWHHMPWAPLGGAGGDDVGFLVVDGWQLRFWEEVLKGRETGVFDSAATVYVLNDGWRDLDAWPPSAARSVDWFLHSGGGALSAYGDGSLTTEAPAGEPPDVFTYEPGLPSLSPGGHSCCVETIVPMGPADQDPVERTKLVLVYTSAPLERDLDVIGDVAVTLYAATDAPDTDFTARLCIVDLEGRSTNLLEGIVRAAYRDSGESPTPITPGEVYEYRIDLGPIGVRFPAGTRIRLQVGSSDFPQWDRNLNTGGPFGQEGPTAGRMALQFVLHNDAHPSRVRLPVVA
jgi:putative CocE/NonD family hydrolase